MSRYGPGAHVVGGASASQDGHEVTAGKSLGCAHMNCGQHSFHQNAYTKPILRYGAAHVNPGSQDVPAHEAGVLTARDCRDCTEPARLSDTSSVIAKPSAAEPESSSSTGSPAATAAKWPSVGVDGRLLRLPEALHCSFGMHMLVSLRTIPGGHTQPRVPHGSSVGAHSVRRVG